MNGEKSFIQIAAFVPIDTYNRLKEISKARGVPVSHLLNFGIDNEFDQKTPFAYVAELPEEVEVDSVIEEGFRIVRYLRKFEGDKYTLEQLLYCRREMKIEDRETFLKALKVLIDKEMIRVGGNPTAKFSYPQGTKFYWWTDPEAAQRSRAQKKKQLEYELEKLNREMGE